MISYRSETSSFPPFWQYSRRDGEASSLFTGFLISVFWLTLCLYSYRSFVRCREALAINISANEGIEELIQNNEEPIDKRIRLSVFYAAKRFVEDGMWYSVY